MYVIDCFEQLPAPECSHSRLVGGIESREVSSQKGGTQVAGVAQGVYTPCVAES